MVYSCRCVSVLRAHLVSNQFYLDGRQNRSDPASFKHLLRGQEIGGCVCGVLHKELRGNRRQIMNDVTPELVNCILIPFSSDVFTDCLLSVLGFITELVIFSVSNFYLFEVLT